MNNTTLKVREINQAIFLLAAQKLQFLGVEVKDNGKLVRYCFHDPQAVGERLLFEFQNGGQASVLGVIATQTFLRREVVKKINSLKAAVQGVSNATVPTAAVSHTADDTKGNR
jgi:hypothetical protein